MYPNLPTLHLAVHAQIYWCVATGVATLYSYSTVTKNGQCFPYYRTKVGDNKSTCRRKDTFKYQYFLTMTDDFPLNIQHSHPCTLQTSIVHVARTGDLVHLLVLLLKLPQSEDYVSRNPLSHIPSLLAWNTALPCRIPAVVKYRSNIATGQLVLATRTSLPCLNWSFLLCG